MQWEYMVREFRVQDSANVSLLEEFLNESGRDGWELVNVTTTPADQFTHVVYLRRIPSPNPLDLASGFPTNSEFRRAALGRPPVLT